MTSPRIPVDGVNGVIGTTVFDVDGFWTNCAAPVLRSRDMAANILELLNPTIHTLHERSVDASFSRT